MYRNRRLLFKKCGTTRAVDMIKKRNNGDGLVCVELGCNRGFNALTWFWALPVKKAYLVDIYKPYITYEGVSDKYGSGYERFMDAKHRLRKFNDRIQFIIKDCVDAANYIHDGEPDYIYYDAQRSYDSVKSNLDVWFPKLKVGGFITGRGFRSSNWEEAKAVLDFMSEHSEDALFDGRCNEWWIERIS